MEYSSSFGARRVLTAILSKFLYILAAVDLSFWIWTMSTAHSMGGFAHILLFNALFAGLVQFMLDRRESRREAEVLSIRSTPERRGRQVA